jgi:hypothetical protein
MSSIFTQRNAGLKVCECSGRVFVPPFLIHVFRPRLQGSVIDLHGLHVAGGTAQARCRVCRMACSAALHVPKPWLTPRCRGAASHSSSFGQVAAVACVACDWSLFCAVEARNRLPSSPAPASTLRGSRRAAALPARLVRRAADARVGRRGCCRTCFRRSRTQTYAPRAMQPAASRFLPKP